MNPRRRILDALIETAAREGYNHTCVERVLEVAKVPAPVFDEYFEDIRDCFIQASDELIGRLELMVLRSMHGEADWPERIRLGLQALLGAVAEYPDGAWVAMIESPRAGEPAAERVRTAEGVFVPVIEEGMEYASSVEHLSAETAVGVVGGIAGIIHKRVLERRTEELPALLPELLYFALMPYLGHERALSAAELGTGAG